MNLNFLLITQFANFSYLFFLITVVFVYYSFKRSFIVLLLASIIFYSSFSLKYTILFLVLCVINFFLGKFLYKYKRKTILILGIVLNLLILIYFRYTNFILDNLYAIYPIEGSKLVIDILIPLGISFFMFEMLHYLIDIYRGNKPINNLFKFILFPFFFPSQIAGPIKRYEMFIPQLNKHVDWELLHDGIFLIIKGFFKKIVIANNLLPLVNAGFVNTADPQVTLIAIYAFAFQIFFDFSGYIDIGRGSAALLGIKVPINFSQPYLSINIREFWRRWHITLMNWFRDYIYIPMGGSRAGKLRHIINTLTVFLLSGLWHGAAWHFIFWGLYHGIVVLLTGLFKFKIKYFNLIKIPLIILNFHLVTLGWVFFRAIDISQALIMLQKLPQVNFISLNITGDIIFISLLLIFYFLNSYIIQLLQRNISLSLIYKFFIYGFSIILIILNMDIITAQFIYFQF